MTDQARGFCYTGSLAADQWASAGDSQQPLLDGVAADIRALLGFYDAPTPVDDPPGRGINPCCIQIDDDGTARWL